MNGSRERTKRISLRDILTVFFFKIHVFFGILITVIVVTMSVALFANPIYKVTGNILVKPILSQDLKLMAPAAAHLTVQPVTIQDINSEVNILSSPELLHLVVKKLSLTKEEEPSDPVSRGLQFLQNRLSEMMVALGLSVKPSPEDQAVVLLQKKLEIKPIALSNVIDISMTGKSPERITRIVNTLLEDYIEYHVSLFRAKGARDFYDRQAEFARQNLKQAEDDLEKFKKEWSIIEITAQNDANIELLRMLRENLAVVKANIADRQTKIGTLQRNLARTGEVGAYTKDFQNAILEELVRAMGPLLTERERVGMHFQKSSPKYQALNVQVEELKKEYDKKIKEIVKGSALDMGGLVSYSRVIEKQIEGVEKRSLLLSEKQVEYDRLVREVKQQEKNYLLYANKTEEARIEEKQDNSRVSNVSVASWAKVPSVPVFPKKVLMGFLSLFCGCLLGIAGSFTAYYMDHTVKTPEDVTRTCGSRLITFVADQGLSGPAPQPTHAANGNSQAKIYSQVPLDTGTISWPERGDVPLWMAEPQRYPGQLENFRALKAYLQFLDNSGKTTVIQLTGADLGVGASTTACNLALVLSWDLFDHRILLVDANLADPVVPQTFGVPGEPGLLNYLTGELTLEQVTHSSPRPNLWVMGAGRPSTQILSPFDLLKFETFLEEVRNQYDYVVLDSAPILRSSDSLTISRNVDGVIIVAEANHTRYEVINDIESRLEGRARVIGSVLNKRRFVIPKVLYHYI